MGEPQKDVLDSGNKTRKGWRQGKETLRRNSELNLCGAKALVQI